MRTRKKTKNPAVNNNDYSVDRRMFARVNIKLPLRFVQNGQKQAKEAHVINICANGVGFINSTKIGPDTALDLWVKVPKQDKSIYISGKVVWSKKLRKPSQKWHTGLQIEKTNLVDLGRVFFAKTTP